MRAALDPERQRSWVLAILKRAYQSKDVKTATRLLRHLARRLDQEHPCAAASVREGLADREAVRPSDEFSIRDVSPHTGTSDR